jgi:ABC-type sugar transport system ATPase subunit
MNSADIPALINLESVSRTFGVIRAVDGVSLEIKPGEIHGLVGHNGAGKSTVVKMIGGLVRPDEGRILFEGSEVKIASPQEAQRIGIAVVDQELSVVPNLSVADNVLLGGLSEPFINRRSSNRKRVIELLGRVGLGDLDPSEIVENLSMGRRQLIEITRALGRNAHLLVLDEPTATLSGAEIEHVFRAVRRVAEQGCAVIFVSHRLAEVIELCDQVTVLRDGKLVDTVETSGINADHIVSMMLGEAPEVSVPMAPPDERPEGESLSISGLSVGDRPVDFSLVASPGRVYALAGQVGCGATEVLRAVAGLEPSAKGSLKLGGEPLKLGSPQASVKAGVSYLSNDRKGDGLFLGLAAKDNLISTRLREVSTAGWISSASARSSATELGGLIGIGEGRLGEPVDNFSGGNQQKILLARYLRRPETRVLLLDEPTRGVDVKGRAEIHGLVKTAAREGATVIFASTEIDELLDLADEIVTMRSGRIVAHHRRGDVGAQRLLSDMTHLEAGDLEEGATSI